MNFLHLFPPELAHRLTMLSVNHGLVPQAKPDKPDLKVRLFGKTFTNPVGLAAGADKKAEALRGWARIGFGFVEAGTVTYHPRRGNPKPRLWRLGHGHLVNWMGLPGDGLDLFLVRLENFQSMPERKNLVIGVSLASPDGILNELKQISAGCAPLADYLTVNVSCPNLSGQGTTQDLIRAIQEQVRAVVAEAGICPVLAKLGPTRHEDSLKVILDSVMQAGASGIVATNTVSWDHRDLLMPFSFDWPLREGRAVGGYSGPAMLHTACWMVRCARSILGPDVPIIGGGGVQSGDDALRLITAGANLIQIYTGLVYKGPALIVDIKKTYSASATK